MTGISTNADDVAARIQGKADRLSAAVATSMRSALLAVEAEAVKNLSGSGSAAAYSYPVPARTGNLKNDRVVSQPSAYLGIIAFLADYAWAVHSGIVTEFAGRGKTRKVQRPARPFADDAVKAAQPSNYIFDAVERVMAT
ncbi:MAG: hypothetical protein P4L92_23060 [Rudaea sp.]|nr:hypothetical protein [Rudaea sp.]